MAANELRRQRPVGIWLLICAGLVFAILVVGGITRLTHSGLSMVEWQPVSGAMPPLTRDAWESLFASYRATPEFKLINRDMTLGGFKQIFWWEYAHRLLGRLSGVVFLVPMIWFIRSGRIPRALASRLTAIFLLGALQGALGWYMVASGLVDDPHVSPFRLAAHLGVALILIGAMLWTAMQLLSPRGAQARRIPGPAAVIVTIVFLMAMTGAMVAGTHAGLVYNTFPLMNGQLVPAGLLALEPWYTNFFYNVATVQFVHRSIAWLLIVLVPSYWMWLRLAGVEHGRRTSTLLLGALGLQVALGISTLLSGVALPLAALHQAGAVILFAAALWNARVSAI
jgi:cytochrome c oxidase assembly protein subunit 15